MIRRTGLLLLVLAALGPTLLSGRPVYHCLITGHDSFISSCCTPEPETETCPHCVAKNLERNPDRPGPQWQACDCCEITTFRCDYTRPPAEPTPPPVLEVSAETFGSPAAVLGLRGTARVHTVGEPPGGPPAFLLHVCFRC